MTFSALPEEEIKNIPIVGSHYTPATVTDKISNLVRRPVTNTWIFGFGIAFVLLMLFN